MKLSAAYLLVYNSLTTFGWAAAATLLLWHLGAKDLAASLSAALPVVSALQIVNLVEIPHVVLGLVRGSVPAALLQAFGRSVVWFCFVVALHRPTALGLPPPSPAGPETQLAEVGALGSAVVLALCWALSELCRYPYYVASQLRSPPRTLQWLRYSGFVVLYPLGAAAEAAVLIKSLSRVAAMQYFDIPPVFHFPTFVYLVAPPGYLIGFPLLYMYMLRQRRRALRRGPTIVQIREPHTDSSIAAIDNYIAKATSDVVVFLYGAVKSDSATVARPFGDSWCPDCTRAFSVIWPRLMKIPEETLVLDVPIDRAPYKGLENFPPRHPLRDHPNICLERLPTLIYFLNGHKGEASAVPGTENAAEFLSRPREPMFDRYALVEDECVVDEDVAALLSAAWKKEQ